MRSITDAIVLRRADWRDYDRMITLLTPNGRVEAVARGCRKPKSPLLAAAEVFTAGEYVLFASKGHYTVEQFRATDTFYPLRMDYDRLLHASYWLRIALMQAMPDTDCSELFALLLRALAHMAYSSTDPVILTMAFELHTLRLLGLSPQMDHCIRCGTEVHGAAWFDIAAGGVTCSRCRRTQPEITHGARRILLRAPLVHFDNAQKLEGHENLLEAAQFTRAFFARHMEIDALHAPDIALAPDC